MDDGKLGGGLLVAAALAGLTRNTGVQASAPAAAAPARKARRDGPAERDWPVALGAWLVWSRSSWRDCIGSPTYSGAARPWRRPGYLKPTKHALGWFR